MGTQSDLFYFSCCYYYGQRNPRASVSRVTTRMPEGKDNMLLRSGKIINTGFGLQGMLIKQNERLKHCTASLSARRRRVVRKQGRGDLQMETIQKLLEEIISLIDLLVSQIEATEEVPSS